MARIVCAWQEGVVPHNGTHKGRSLTESVAQEWRFLPCSTFISQTFQSEDKSCLRKEIPGSEIQKLQQQNANLRAVIAQMRKEMESLDEQTASSVPRREQSAPGHTAGIPPLTAAVLMGRAEGAVTLLAV